MLERFTDGARAVVVDAAQAEARSLHHGFVGTEHLLLALISGGGPAADALYGLGVTADDTRARIVDLLGDRTIDPDALAAIGIDLDKVRELTEAAFGPGALDAGPGRRRQDGRLPYTKRATKVLGLSVREAIHLGPGPVGTGHVLLGLLREGDGLAARALAEAGVDFRELRADVTQLITAEAA